MFEFIIYILAFFITIPIIATIITFVVSTKWRKSKQKAVHMAVNWTTLFYIIAVVILFRVVFGLGIISYVLIFLLVVLAIILIFQWKVFTEITLKKAMKILIRFSFLVFLFLYICLMLIGLIGQIYRL